MDRLHSAAQKYWEMFYIMQNFSLYIKTVQYNIKCKVQVQADVAQWVSHYQMAMSSNHSTATAGPLSKALNPQMLRWGKCKDLWIRVSAKWYKVNVNGSSATPTRTLPSNQVCMFKKKK